MSRNRIRKFKIDRKSYGLKWALKSLFRDTKYQLKIIRVYVYRYGLSQILIWCFPVVGTVLLLSRLEDMENQYTSLQRYVISNTYIGMKDLIKRIEVLEKK